jgi:RNA-directed DNA polymerase
MDPPMGNTHGAPDPAIVSTQQRRIADLARQMPQTAFTTLAHPIDLAWLREAFRRTRKDGATGVDGQTAAAYAEDLASNLASLLERAKSGRYHAPPVRRVHIPKGRGGETRPIGIPTFEDKVLQRAVAMVLEPLYEQEFLDGSWGFRPGRSAHQALQVLWERLTSMAGGWIVEVDIQKFFDTLDHGHLRRFLDQRVRDGVVRRLLGKWLRSGVLEAGVVTRPEAGTPQGGVISPLLANVYLHYVLDVWFEWVVRPRLGGPAFLVRYADDFVLVFAREADARRVLSVLPKRFGRYGLTLHPTKTRLVDFRRPEREARRAEREHSFELLGFRHYWGRSRRGRWTVKRKTAPARLSRALAAVGDWCRRHRHLPVAVQHRSLVQKIRGHYAYYGLTGNLRSLGNFLYQVQRRWRKWLDRRSQRSRMNWERFGRLLERYPLPRPVVCRSVYRP